MRKQKLIVKSLLSSVLYDNMIFIEFFAHNFEIALGEMVFSTHVKARKRCGDASLAENIS